MNRGPYIQSVLYPSPPVPDRRSIGHPIMNITYAAAVPPQPSSNPLLHSIRTRLPADSEKYFRSALRLFRLWSC